MQKPGITAGADHIHPTVRVVVENETIPVPTDFSLAEDGRALAPFHFHDGDQTIHAEGVRADGLTLRQFMTVWGVPATPTRSGPYRETAERKVWIYVKRKGQKRFTEADSVADVPLGDGDEVYLIYGTPEQSPITV